MNPAGGIGFPKGPSRATLKARKQRVTRDHIRAVRAHVFAREQHICRCCGWRRAESMHELRPRSLGGKVSVQNSIAVCGDGVRGCHGFLQRHDITYRFDRHRSADYWIAFKIKSQAACDYVGVFLGCERAAPSGMHWLI